MSGVFGANLMSYLKLLTPYEIRKVAKTKKRVAKVSLTSTIASELDDSPDTNVLLFRKKEEEGKQERGNKNLTYSPQRVKMASVASGKDNKEDEQYQDVDHNLVSFTEFLLSQKKKLESAQKKLKRREVIGLYHSSDSTEQDTQDGGSIDTDSNKGVLVNKKHY